VYSLYDLNEYIKRVLALNFQEAIWITAEIAQINQSKGHFYLELVQKGEGLGDDIIAQANAMLWARDYYKLRADLGKDLDEVLREGLQVKIQVKVSFSERYGLKLMVESIDLTHTFGQLELQRRQILRRLQELRLIGKNKQIPLPAVLQRIAIVTSETAAGFQDFIKHLNDNQYGYFYELQLFKSTMQGNLVATELPRALAAIAKKADQYDVVVIIRGGGARLDLAAFDGFEVCKAVAQMPIPVITGIGHDIDETLMDLSAHTALKTPTAVADFLVQNNLVFESNMLYLGEYLKKHTRQVLQIQTMELDKAAQIIHWNANAVLKNHQQVLQQIEGQIPLLVQRNLQQQKRVLASFEQICKAFDPKTTLKRGFSITYKNGKVVKNLEDIKAKDKIETHLKDGKFSAIVVD
jgi:exodeoxyribonuclease VII large subunit